MAVTTKSKQLVSRFAFKPNQLHYCGADSANKKMYRCITEGKCKNIGQEIKTFMALYPYLNTISTVHKLSLLDERVVEAYILGNTLLNKFTSDDFETHLGYFETQGVPKFFTDELRDKFHNSQMPFIPHHSFNVLFVGVGNVTGAVKYNIDNINNCLIRWGTVVSQHEKKNKIHLKTFKLIVTESIFEAVEVDEEVSYLPEIFPDISVGDSIAMHWRDAMIVLNKTQTKQLETYTNKVIDSYNKTISL